ncbi:MAG: hypothetical protein KC503_27935, partial [Myxococcales bacterium]|nr:hypothetical protein [Myxococcales bacterium]
MSPPRLVILDMDGVLLELDLDSERVRAEIAALVERATGAPRRMVPLMATLDEVLRELDTRDPAGASRLRADAFAAIDAESFDYAVMEKTDNAAVCRSTFGW